MEREREKQREVERSQRDEALRLTREKERLRFVRGAMKYSRKGNNHKEYLQFFFSVDRFSCRRSSRIVVVFTSVHSLRWEGCCAFLKNCCL